MIAKCTRGVLAAILCVCCLSFLNGQTDVLDRYECKLIPKSSEIDLNCDRVRVVELVENNTVVVLGENNQAAYSPSTVGGCVAQPCYRAYFPKDVRVCQYTGNPNDTCRGTLSEVTLKATHIGTCSSSCRCIRLDRLPREQVIKKWMWRCNI